MSSASEPRPRRSRPARVATSLTSLQEGSEKARAGPRSRPCRRLLGTSRALERSDGGGSGGSARQAVSSSASEAKAASYCVYPMQGPVRLANETPLQRPALTSTRAGPIQQRLMAAMNDY